jgi:uncharacterized protein YjbI with pentapeptide repeats
VNIQLSTVYREKKSEVQHQGCITEIISIETLDSQSMINPNCRFAVNTVMRMQWLKTFTGILLFSVCAGCSTQQAPSDSASVPTTPVSPPPLSSDILRERIEQTKECVGCDLTQTADPDYLSNIKLAEVNLEKANLSGLSLTGTNLNNANLKGANLTQTNLSAANLLQANLQGANLSEANLSGAELTKANLTQATLQKTDLTEAYLLDTNLNKANLSNADLDGANLTGAQINQTNLSNTSMIGTTMPDGQTHQQGELLERGR